MRIWRGIGITAAGVLGVGIVAAAIAQARWSSRSARIASRLALGRVDAGSRPASYSPDQLAGLPAPVVRYFERVLRPGQRMIGAARIVQRGEFALSRDRWMPFTATGLVSVRPLGFMWDASIR
ncbi:MAG: hypothetical protein HOQ11_13685, partial [Gemmatimonadaceae bacterium]|nr:hypothetical protein [Gemmatimonadaceae bacterium]